MSLLFLDSFDHYATADLTAKWTSITNTPAITSGGRRSTNCVELQSGEHVKKTLAPGDTTGVVGFALNPGNPSSAFDVFYFMDVASQQVGVRVLSNLTLQVQRGGSTTLGTSTLALNASTYYYIEFKALISNTVGTYEVRVNGVNWVSGTGADTQATANAVWNGIDVVGGNGTALVDDLYVLDGVASADPTYPDNTFLGDVRIDALFPTAEGTTIEWTPSTGTNNAALVDETPPDTTDYNSAAATEKDTYTMPDVPVSGALILGYQVCLYLEKTDAGACTVAPVIRSVGSDYVGTAIAPSNGSYAYFLAPYSVDPATNLVPTEANWNAGEVGVKRVT